MEEEDLEEIIRIDETTFKRPEPRSIKNLSALRMSDPEGCFVLKDESKIVGYNYSKTMGNEGYLGPIGIMQSYQNRGLGKALISKSMDYLLKNCDVIGLEVLPENGNVIGLYQRMGFTSGFPSYLFQISEEFKIKKINSDDLYISNASENGQSEYDAILSDIDEWTNSSFNGLSFRNDLNITFELDGDILVVFNGDKPAGFLAYSQNLIPTVWGAVDSNIKDYKLQKKIMKSLILHFYDLNGVEDVVIQINSRYNVLVDILFKMGFKLKRSINRMYYNGLEGDGFKQSNQLLIRPWRG
jgi:ribosomal protein S18 acetylase RimI-like enzyme